MNESDTKHERMVYLLTVSWDYSQFLGMVTLDEAKAKAEQIKLKEIGYRSEIEAIPLDATSKPDGDWLLQFFGE